MRIDISDPAGGECEYRSQIDVRDKGLTLFRDFAERSDIGGTIGREILFVNVGRQFDITMSIEDAIRSTVPDAHQSSQKQPQIVDCITYAML